MFLDTSGLLCYLYIDEPQHNEAVKLFKALPRKRLLTHAQVLSELIVLASARGFPRTAAISLTIDLLNSPDVEVVWIDRRLHTEAVHLLLQRQDKSYSLCDAISFVLMKQHRMSKALTTDRHFEQEGFIRLLPPPS